MVATIAKAGIIAGIVFVGFMMVVLGITILPMSLNSFNNNMLLGTDEELEKLFIESKEYIAFAERFPDHEREFSRDPYSAQFQAGVMNADTGNQLILELSKYGNDESRIDKSIYCESTKIIENERDTQMMHSNGVMVRQFIETTNCLD